MTLDQFDLQHLPSGHGYIDLGMLFDPEQRTFLIF